MKKEKKVIYGIEITKPWSSEMYAHNEQVAEVVKELVSDMFRTELTKFEESLESEDEFELEVMDLDWDAAPDSLKEIQRAITCYGFGYGYTVERVAECVENELENAPTYRLKEIAEELELKLEKEFIGFN